MAKKKQTGRRIAPRAAGPVVPATHGQLLTDLRALILSAREGIAQAVNSALVLLCWQIGRRIRTEILKEQRAAYGEAIVATVSRELAGEFGRGFTDKAIWRMIQFAEAFSDREIVAALSRQLGWSHFVEIIPIEDPLKRDFYAEMCRVEHWSVRTLRAKMRGMLFERTALSKKPVQLARQELAALRDEDRLTPDLVFRDPYFLDFLGLADAYSEQDLEHTILRELESFILELGGGFAFCCSPETHDNRQKRLLSRPPILSPHPAPSGRSRVEARAVRGRPQRADGTEPSLAREARDAARRGRAAGLNPLR